MGVVGKPLQMAVDTPFYRRNRGKGLEAGGRTEVGLSHWGRARATVPSPGISIRGRGWPSPPHGPLALPPSWEVLCAQITELGPKQALGSTACSGA